MAFDYATGPTPQSEPLPGENMAKNNAGGYTYRITDFARFQRFLILGASSGTFYVGKRQHINDNIELLRRIFNDDSTGIMAVTQIVEVSTAGRAHKNSHAIFALAVATSVVGKPIISQAAFRALPQVCRTATHLFEFVEYRQQVGAGWGRTMRAVIKAWYEDRTTGSLEHQLVKYQQRNGWTHRDVIRKSHFVTKDPERDELYRWALGKAHTTRTPLVSAMREAHAIEGMPTDKQIAEAVTAGLSREMVPTAWLKDPRVWQSWLSMRLLPMTAMVRNLGTMTACGALKELSEYSKAVVDRLSDEQAIRKARLHPVQLIEAQKVYESGGGHRGKLDWTPVGEISMALDQAAISAFHGIEKHGKRVFFGLDISGSMDWGVAGSILNSREAAAGVLCALAGAADQAGGIAFSRQPHPLKIHSRGMLPSELHRQADKLPFGATDCAQPMLYALKQGIETDVFVILTDNETWYGNVHPVQALNEYRRKVNPNAKLVVLATESTEFSVADPNDAGCLDIAGFDAAVPQLIHEFVKS